MREDRQTVEREVLAVDLIWEEERNGTKQNDMVQVRLLALETFILSFVVQHRREKKRKENREKPRLRMNGGFYS